jgi:crossover junction endodeoxyribonuclease RuvC
MYAKVSFVMTYDPSSQVLALDPGLNGAWAALGFNGEFIDAGELPRFGASLDATGLSRLMRLLAPQTVVIEKVGAMPKQGVSSTFKFGASWGVCIGVAGGVGAPVVFVQPRMWKGHFRLINKPKDAARELAILTYPDAAQYFALKKHCGRADALLMARYALDKDAGRQFA